jgi:hypothetical protein
MDNMARPKRFELLTPRFVVSKDVTRTDIAKIHLDWSHTPFQANRVLSVVGSLYSFAGKNGLVPEEVNPARGVDKYPEDRRERLLSVGELERIGGAIREAETTGISWHIDPTKKVKHVPKKARRTVIGEHGCFFYRGAGWRKQGIARLAK